MVAVIAITASLLIPGIVGTAKMPPEFNRQALLTNPQQPSNANARERLRLSKLYFPPDEAPFVEILSNYNSRPISEMRATEVKSRMTTMHALIKTVAKDLIYDGTVNSWYNSFMDSTTNATIVSGYDFFILLRSFLYNHRWQYFSDAQLFTLTPGDTVFVTVSRITFFLRNLRTRKAKREAMRILQLLDNTSSPPGSTVVASPSFPIWEGLATIASQTRNAMLAGVAIIIGSLSLFNVDVVTSIITCITVIATVIDTWGLLYFWGWDQDPVVTISLFLSAALIISTSQAFVVSFLSVGGATPEDRLQSSLTYCWHVALTGGTAFFLASLPFAGSDSYIFKVSSQALLTVAVLRLYHSLIFLPMMLALFRPLEYKISNDIQGPKRNPSNEDPTAKESAAGGDGNSGNDAMLNGLTLKFRPLPRIAPFVTIPEDEVLEGNPTISMPSIED